MSIDTRPAPEYIYKITTGLLWAEAETSGIVPPMPIDEQDGYMHFSTAGQVAETLRLHFKGQSDLALLRVRLADIAAGVKWEPSRGGALFPHLYASLPTAAIAAVHKVAVAENGACDLPEMPDV